MSTLAYFRCYLKTSAGVYTSVMIWTVWGKAAKDVVGGKRAENDKYMGRGKPTWSYNSWEDGVAGWERIAWNHRVTVIVISSVDRSELGFFWNDLPWISGLVVILHEEICKVTSFSKARGVTVWPNAAINYRLPRVYVREKCITLGKVADVMECILKCSAVDGMWIYCWLTRLNMFLINHRLPQLLS